MSERKLTFDERLDLLRRYRKRKVQYLEELDPRKEGLLRNAEAGFIGLSALCGALVFASIFGVAAADYLKTRPEFSFLKSEPSIIAYCTNENGEAGTHVAFKISFRPFNDLSEGVTVVTTASSSNKAEVISHSQFYSEVPIEDTIHVKRSFRGRVMLFRSENIYDSTKRYTDDSKKLYEKDVDIKC